MRPLSFELNFFTCDQLSHKRIVNNLERLKDSFMQAFIDFI